RRVTVTGNSAFSGGGIHADFDMTLTNVTVTGNIAQNNGGGITNSAIATLISVTLADNIVQLSGDSSGNYNGLGDATFEYVIVGFAGGPGGDHGSNSCYSFGVLTSGGHNLDTGNTC